MSTKTRTLTMRQANIPKAIAIEVVGWDTHHLYELAYDGAVDGLVRAIRQFDDKRFREDQFDGWLVYCARKEAYNRLSKRSDRKVKCDHLLTIDVDRTSSHLGPVDDGPTPVDELIEGEEWAFLRRAMSSLAPDEMELLNLYFTAGISLEYARSVGLKSRQAVYYRIRKIIERLRFMARRECLL